MKILKNMTKMIAALGLAWILLTNLFPVMVYADTDTMSFTELQAHIDSAADGGTVILEKNVNWKNGTYGLEAGDSGPLVIPEGKTITLDLNGHTIDRGLKGWVNGVKNANVITVSGNLTLTDSSADGTGKLTGGNTTKEGGGVFIDENATFTMEGGSITDCITNSQGGGVNVNGTFNMTGGTISGCTANNGAGGGVKVKGTFNMTGGTISGCTGRGVFVDSGATFTMSGSARIDGCTYFSGGGVYVNGGTFTMEGGTITGCTATNGHDDAQGGGGVYLFGGTFKVSGAPVISGNKKGDKTNNVTLNGSKTITVTGELTDGAEIRVSGANGKVIAKPGTGYTITAADAEKFHSDTDSGLIGAVDGGNVVFKEAVYIDGVSAQNKEYDGNKSATVTGTATLKKLKDNTSVNELTVSDITAEFVDKNVGDSKTVTITGGILSNSVNYVLVPGGTTGLTASITKATNTAISVPRGSFNKKYGDGAFSLGATTNVGATPIHTITKGTDVISLSGDNMVTILKPGEVTIKISLPETENYVAAEDKTINISIAKADAPSTKPAASVTVAYEIDRVSGVSLPAGWTWSASDRDKELIEEGTVTMTAEYSAADKGNYLGGLTATVNITRQKKPTIPIDGAIISGVTEKTYNGSAQTQDPIVSLDGRTLVNGTDYTVSYTDNVNAGTATMVITGIGNFEGSETVTFRILSPDQAKDMANAEVIGLDPSGYEYTGKAIKASVEVYIGGTRLTNKKDYTISYKKNKKAGTATITIKGKGKNHKGSKSVSFTINKIENPLQATGKTTALKLKSVTKKKQNLSVSKIIKITKKGKGKLSYSKLSGDERITVATKNGKVTVAKGTPAGDYVLEVEVTAAGDTNYESGTSRVTAHIIIK